MSSQHQKVDVESLSSLSIDPNQVAVGASNIFGGGRKSSFEYINILKDSDQLPRKDFRNSLDILTSNINTTKPMQAPLKQIIQLYNEENKVKIEQQGFNPLEIGVVYSESEDDERVPNAMGAESEVQNKVKFQSVYNDSKFNYHSYFPHSLAEALCEREIPLQYVRGLLMVRDQKEIKTTRRLKVERYLEKRRKKTWNRKICYNCRQKVAEERLRIKGKFIKKRRAMEILGLTIPIDTAQLKQMLYEFMKNKNHTEIEQLLNIGKKEKQEGDENEGQSQMDEQGEQEQGQQDEM